MLSETHERPATVERLLTREQINELTDLEWLEAELDKVTSDAKGIEVDLEFRSDDYATDDWEHRARRALQAHYVCQGHLTRRIAALKRGERKVQTPVEIHDAKARKREAEAARLTAAAENKRLRAAEEREKTIRQCLAYASRQSLLLCFQNAAREHLDRETFGRLMAIARAELEASMLADATAQGTSGSAQDAQRLDPEGAQARSSRSEDAPNPFISRNISDDQ